jgi:glycyl-tRNA synthetase beta subunit
MKYSADLYELDGVLAYDRARVVGGIIRSLYARQREALGRLKFGDSSTWPDLPDQVDKRSLSHRAHVAVMTYASEMFSWYAGSVEGDVYFCPERHATYFGSFYMKDIPAMGNANYSISTSLTGDSGEAFLAALTDSQRQLVTGLVGEFPELQGIAGGLLLRAEGADERVADAVYEHYKPAGPEDTVPATVLGSVVSVADKLDTVSELLAGGESPTGSRDPFGLRRATNAIFRIVTGSGWSLSLRDMVTLTGTTATASVIEFLVERFQDFLRDAGASPNEIQAIARPKIGLSEFESWPLGDVLRRLDAVKTVRRRDDFARLVELTKRVDNILTQGAAYVGAAEGATVEPSHVEVEEAAIGLSRLLDERDVVITSAAEARDYASVIDLLASFVSPVARFFDEVLVLDTEKIPRTRARLALLSRLRTVLTRYFDIRELAGQADRRA